jgi:hypothetical protein
VEGVRPWLSLFHENHHKAVNFDGHDGGQGGERDVSGDADEREVSDASEEAEHRSEHSARGCGRLPVYQLFRGLLGRLIGHHLGGCEALCHVVTTLLSSSEMENSS